MPFDRPIASSAGHAPTPESQRPRELVDWLDRKLFHPPARWIALAARPMGASPNMVSVLGTLVMCAAAAAYVGLSWPQSALIGFLLQFLAGVVDGADGDLARLTGKTSANGEVVDAACDYIGQIVLYVALAAFLDDRMGGWAWAIASLAGASHIIQMNHAESQRRHYLWWAYQVPWLNARQAVGQQRRKADWFGMAFGWVTRQYLRLASAMAPHAARVDAQIDAAGRDTERIARISALTRQSFGRCIAYQQALSANPRWIILGVSMLLGSPLWYFLAEMTAMNLLFAMSLREHNRCTRELAETTSSDSRSVCDRALSTRTRPADSFGDEVLQPERLARRAQPRHQD